MLISVFDFETTGLEIATARVVEMAVALYDTESGKIVSSYSGCLYDNDYPAMDPVASVITGVSDEYLKRSGGAPYEAWKNFVAIMKRGQYVMGHNSRRFDIPLALEEFKRFDLNFDFSNNIDTRFDPVYPSHIETRKLEYLAVHYGIPVQASHAALADVMTTYALFSKFPQEDILRRAASPEVYIKAHVDFDNKDKAKEQKYFWDANTKSWMKCVKLCDMDQEKGDFKKEVIVGYKPPK
jgi:DNA polymerase III epsilon subunit-like protein